VNTFRRDDWPAYPTYPVFYSVKKTPMSTAWAFQLHRRYESRYDYKYRTPEDSGGAYRWIALIVLLSFGAGVLVADIVLRFV